MIQINNQSVFQAEKIKIKNKAGKIILDDFSFNIKPGEIWMLSGPNGIGKSSLYEALIGLRTFEKGNIFLESKNITYLQPAERIRLGLKYIAQANALFNWSSVQDNLTIIAQSLVERKYQKTSIQKAVELFELENFLNKSPSKLSGGQQRLVELSKILIGLNKITILDEPFAAIDHLKIQKLCSIFTDLSKTGIAFFINDHNQDELRKIANFEIILGEEKIINLN